MTAEGQVMVASHHPYLVALSVVISILGTYAARGLTERIRGAPWLRRFAKPRRRAAARVG